jgi:hypothetical protein
MRTRRSLVAAFAACLLALTATACEMQEFEGDPLMDDPLMDDPMMDDPMLDESIEH